MRTKHSTPKPPSTDHRGIGSLRIVNFQSHKDTTLDFHEGVNVITGSSDAGKTAILRALEWVIFNRPAGEAFRSRWGGGTRVDLKMDSDIAVVRQKGKTLNTYELYEVAEGIDSKGEALSKTFKAFGQNVPEEIAAAINIPEINIQRQHASPYLLSSSSGEVARSLQDVVNLDAISRGLSNIDGSIQKNKQTVSAETNSLEGFEEDLKKFVYLKAMERDIEEVEKLVEKRNKIKKQINILTNTGELIRKYKGQLAGVDAILETEEEVDKLLALRKIVVGKDIVADNLEEMIDNISMEKTTLDKASDNLKYAQREFKRTFPQTCPLCEQEVKK